MPNNNNNSNNDNNTNIINNNNGNMKIKKSLFKSRRDNRSRRFLHGITTETTPYCIPPKELLQQQEEQKNNSGGGTPVTDATTPTTPLEYDIGSSKIDGASYFDILPLHTTDDGYLGDPEEVRSQRRLRRGWTMDGVSRRLSRSSSTTATSRQYSSCSDLPSPTTSSSDSSPERSRRRRERSTSPTTDEIKKNARRLFRMNRLLWFTIVLIISMGTMYWSYPIVEEEKILAQYQNRRQYHRGRISSGLKGEMVRRAGQHNGSSSSPPPQREIRVQPEITISPETSTTTTTTTATANKKKNTKNRKSQNKITKSKPSHSTATITTHIKPSNHRKKSERPSQQLKFNHPPPLDVRQSFELQDRAMYDPSSKNNISGDSSNRVVSLGGFRTMKTPVHRAVALYPVLFTDNTQLYGLYDSDDERLSRMEIREPLEHGECVPMQKWQTTFHPSCNGVHELGLEQMGSNTGDDFNLFGTKGFWRNAWKLDLVGGHSTLDERETLVLKTLKFVHNFEDAHFEHDRVDAVAMERLTSSPHVINLFGFCGHSVMTEYADGSRVGELADKSKKTPLARLKIARDIAMGLADVHGIDGDGNTTFVHLDINPANVVSIGGTLKLNDFNIGILQRWNTTSNKPCGFPTQYPNPQWRSPEEARNEQNLTEKVDVFSMGHIFFRLICGHEPWNKLEIGGRPSKEEVNEKVQKGILPHIPEGIFATDNSEVKAIRDAMLDCYTYDPHKRPSAHKIALKLQDSLELFEKEKTSQESKEIT
eukprot:CAMPEP_0194174542 /NCGR_PEP_ID=MMETSP0154-20130528/8704_1 /TAXON_ID=1049557 /ORGANISM="Thalassiothrix antarctica, Strain L6-D1" /LENGTH=762 /DNA_ID=CAMNT_0038887995 /DNA_START=96 /DNA_END=2384 /DNA_ORIENTATION=+